MILQRPDYDYGLRMPVIHWNKGKGIVWEVAIETSKQLYSDFIDLLNKYRHKDKYRRGLSLLTYNCLMSYLVTERLDIETPICISLNKNNFSSDMKAYSSVGYAPMMRMHLLTT